MQNGGISAALGAASPLLLGVGQDLLAGPSAPRQGLARGMAQFAQKTEEDKRKRRAAQGIQSLFDTPGALPEGGAGQVIRQMAETDPEAAMQLWQQLRIAEAGRAPAKPSVLETRAAGAGLQPGSPEYQEFMLHGGVAPEPEPIKPQSPVAKLVSDYRNGLIDQETFNSAREKLMAGEGFDLSLPDGTSFRYGDGGVASRPPTANVTDALKGKAAFDSLMKGFDDFEAAVQEGGASLLPGQYRDSLLEMRRGLQLQMKELFNLGVLNGPDLMLMDQLLVDPTSFGNVAMDAVGLADIRGRNKANMSRLRKMMADLIQPKLDIVGAGERGPQSPPAAGSPNFGDMSDDDLRAWIAENE